MTLRPPSSDDLGYPERLARDGYVSIDRPYVPAAHVDEVRERIDVLFARRSQLPPAAVRDLGSAPDLGCSVPEINWVSNLDPALTETAAFSALADLACILLGAGRVRSLFDHAIYKPADVGGATAWHQDAVYDRPVGRDRAAVTLWLALDDVSRDAGCMMFVPGSHIGPLHPHVPHGHGFGVIDADVSTSVECPLPKGGCTAHSARTLHGAGPNRSARVRPAWIVKFAPDDRTWLIRTASAQRRQSVQRRALRGAQ